MKRRMQRLLPAAMLLTIACGRGPAGPAPDPHEDGGSADPYTLRAATHFVDGLSARTPRGAVHAVVEIPAGTTDKWEVEEDGVMRWELENGQPRVVRYLGYPANYGMVPRTLLPAELGGDGDPLDVIVLGPAVERGRVVEVRLLGVLKMLDGGEVDDKLLAVREGTPLAGATDLASLDQRFPGVTTILEVWFTNYKGAGEIESLGFGGIGEAERILQAGIEAYEAQRSARRAEAS